MKTIKMYKVDAFNTEVFRGNPAAVCLCDDWLEDELMLKIAQENALPETAFVVDKGEFFHLRWFTPEIEIDLCGHATLATSHVIFTNNLNHSDKIHFDTRSGLLFVEKKDHGTYSMNLPSRPPKRAKLPKVIADSLNKQPIGVYKARDYILLYEHEQDIYDLNPNQEIMGQINLDPGGVCCTAIGKNVDFVSRYFTPQASIFEDPVTGSSFSSLVPFWSDRLGTSEMVAKQISAREGVVYCVNLTDRVEITGHAVIYFEGEMVLPS